MEDSIAIINFTENKGLRELLAYRKRCVMFEECQCTQCMVGGPCSLLDMLLQAEILAECRSEDFERVDHFNFSVLVHNCMCWGNKDVEFCFFDALQREQICFVPIENEITSL